ncbi:MAG: murein biosynthesis integral membrane protein MurJ [Armatimonadetes bacterium]|nr:murein biosynthesis integral membrane protein MurJ [Armatimonadota bacterium]
MPEGPPHDSKTPSTGDALGSAAMLMAVATFASSVAGVVRQMVFSRHFGTTEEFQAYIQAFRIPDLFYFLVAGGALRTGFIPVFTKYLAEGKADRAWRTFSITFYVLGLLSVIAVGVGMLFAPWLVQHTVGIGMAPQYQDLCARFMRTMFPAQVFFIVGGLLMGTLNAQRHFSMPAWGPVAYNLVIIVGALASLPLAQRMGAMASDDLLGQRLWVVSAFVVIGAALGNVFMQIAPLVKRGARLLPVFDLRDEGLKNLVLLALPVILGLAVSEITFVVSTSVATKLGEQAATLLEYPNRVWKLPPRMFGAGIAIALFPTLATHFAKGAMDAYRHDLARMMRNAIFLSLPSMVICIALAAPTMRLLFEGGEFVAEDRILTAGVLLWCSLGIVPLSLQYIVARGFYALHETKTPLWVGGATAVLSIGLSLTLYRPLGVYGLAGIYSFTNLFNAALMTWLLRRRVGPLEGRRMVTMLARLLVPTVVLAAVCWGGVAALTRALPAERKVASIRPELLALSRYVRTHRLLPDDARRQAEGVLAASAAAPWVRLETTHAELEWEERAYTAEAQTNVAALRADLQRLRDEVGSRTLRTEDAAREAREVLDANRATRYVDLKVTPDALLWHEQSMGLLLKALACLGPMALGLAAFLVLCGLFRVEEMHSAWRLVTDKFRRRTPTGVDATPPEPDMPE